MGDQGTEGNAGVGRGCFRAFGLSGAVLALTSTLGLCLGATAPASAAATAMRALSGNEAPVPPGATPVGPAPTSDTLPLTVGLQPRNPAALTAYAQAVSDPRSPDYRNFLTPAQFANRFGATATSISSVTAALRNEGLDVGPPSPLGLSLPVSGTVGQAESAFSTPITKYKLSSGKAGYHNDGAPKVPATVAPQIEGVLGLDTLTPPKPQTSPPQASPGLSQPSVPAASPSLAPGQPSPGSSCSSSIATQQSRGSLDAPELAQAYSFGSLYSGNSYGAGTTIALVEMYTAGYSRSDIKSFADCYGITPDGSQVTERDVSAGAGGTGGGTVESELDIETALSLAPKANIEVYEGGPSDDIYSVLQAIVGDDTAKIVSVSWTNGCEAYVGTSMQNLENTLLQAATTEGQSVFAASGDQGSEGCNVNGETSAATGSNPVAQAVDPSTGTLYVANENSNTVTVDGEGDGGNNTTAGSVPTGSAPDAIALDSSDHKVFVANTLASSLTVFPSNTCNDTTTSGCGSTTTVSSGVSSPRALAASGSTLYVANGNGTVAVYNDSSDRLAASVTLPTGTVPTALAVDATNGFVYVTDGSNGRVVYFNETTCNATTQTTCGSPPGTVNVGTDPVALAVDASAGSLYVANGSGVGGISVVSLATHAVTTTISTGNPAVSGLDGSAVVESIGLSPDGKEVLAVLHGLAFPGDVMATIAPSTNTLVATANLNLQSGNDLMGQLVSDGSGSRDFVWVTDETNGQDVLQNLSLSVSDPASQPFVTAVGGTSLPSGSLGPPPAESTWNDQLDFAEGAGGGGISQTFTMPSYQQSFGGVVTGSSGTPCDNSGGYCREVPDVSADADPNTGYIVYDTVNTSGWVGVGGTSGAAPLWAAVTAVAASAKGVTVGFGDLNPVLYYLAQDSPGHYLNDVTAGTNDFNATNGGSYPAMSGYDMATGLGTPVVSALASGLTTILVAVSGSQTYGTYGGPPTFHGTANTPPGVTLDQSGLTCTTVASSTSISPALAAGAYTLLPSSCSGATLSGTNESSYTIAYTSALNDFVVDPAPVNVAVSGSQTYGGSPTFTGASTSSGPGSLPPGISLSTVALTCTTLTVATTIAPTVPVSSNDYTLVPDSCSGATLNGSNSADYTVDYTAAAKDFIVNPAHLTITASSLNMTYGSTVPTIAPQYSGFVNGDTSSKLSTQPSCSTSATSSTPVSASPQPTSCGSAADTNYTISYVGGAITINPAPLIITASSGNMTQGGAVPAIRALYSTFPSGQGPSSLSSQPTCSTTATSSSSVGAYPSTCHGASDNDYNISYVAGQVSVSPVPHGYWLVGSDGGIFTFGAANFYGSTGNIRLQRPVVGITPTENKGGYWLVASDGGIFAFGNAGFYGSIPGQGLHPAGSGLVPSLNAPIVGMVPSADGGGYFMVASDGGVFAFGDARFEGSCPGIGGCVGAAVSVVPDASGDGYWLVTQSGHVYAFGDAVAYGAPGPQAAPVTSAVRASDGNGYLVLLANGSVFSYGDAVGRGGPSGVGGSDPASAIFTDSGGGGYWVSTAQGAVYTYGDAPNDGSMAGTALNGSIIAATGF